VIQKPRRRFGLIAVAFVIVLAGAAGGAAVATKNPFEGGADAKDAQPTKAEIRKQLGLPPDAKLTREEDGTYSFTSGKISPEEMAHQKRAQEVADNGHAVLRCGGSGATVRCLPVEGPELRKIRPPGQVLYQRHTIIGVTDLADGKKPVFSADDLICGRRTADGSIPCAHPDAVRPTIAAGDLLQDAPASQHLGGCRDRAAVGAALPRFQPLTRARRALLSTSDLTGSGSRVRRGCGGRRAAPVVTRPHAVQATDSPPPPVGHPSARLKRTPSATSGTPKSVIWVIIVATTGTSGQPPGYSPAGIEISMGNAGASRTAHRLTTAPRAT
jgi:hypothetical protein